jgi:prepilin-type N-terminal cleavage/methylation domain-containing protein
MHSPILQGSRAGRRGFTLIEVMASMMLVAIILPVAMKGVSLALQTAGLARQRSLAASLAETELADLLTANTFDQTSTSGDFPDYPGYKWTADLTEWASITTSTGTSTSVQQLEVGVQWTSRGQERSVTLDTLIYTSPSATSTGTGATTGAGTGGIGQ